MKRLCLLNAYAFAQFFPVNVLWNGNFYENYCTITNSNRCINWWLATDTNDQTPSNSRLNLYSIGLLNILSLGFLGSNSSFQLNTPVFLSENTTYTLSFSMFRGPIIKSKSMRCSNVTGFVEVSGGGLPQNNISNLMDYEEWSLASPTPLKYFKVRGLGEYQTISIGTFASNDICGPFLSGVQLVPQYCNSNAIGCSYIQTGFNDPPMSTSNAQMGIIFGSVVAAILVGGRIMCCICKKKNRILEQEDAGSAQSIQTEALPPYEGFIGITCRHDSSDDTTSSSLRRKLL